MLALARPRVGRRAWRWWRRSSAGSRSAGWCSVRASNGARAQCAGTRAVSLSIAAWSLLLLRIACAVQRLGAAADRRAALAAVALVAGFAALLSGCFCRLPPRWARPCRRWNDWRRCVQRDGRSIAALYASNTFGAVLGVLGAAFWLIPALGLARSAVVCVALNLACAAIALVRVPEDRRAAESAPTAAGSSARGALLRLAAHAAFSASATRCWSCACSARSPRTRSTPSRCCSPSI